MANRRFRSQFQYGLEAMIVELYLVADIGAAGAPTLRANDSKGIESMVRDSAGQYTITLQDQYNKLLALDIGVESTNPPAAPLQHLEVEDVASAKTLQVQFLDIDNSTPTDPANGEVVRMRITLGNSSV